MPGFEHALCQMRLGAQFMQSLDYLVLSELNLELDGWRCVPDICVFPAAMQASLRQQTWVTEVPLVAVEIASPSQTLDEASAKIEKLLEHGVRSVWFVLPMTRVISIFQKGSLPMSATTGTLIDPATGIAVKVEEIFA